MKIFFFIYGDYHNRVGRIQETFGKSQPFLHHGKPLAVTISITAIHVVVIVFPVTSPCVIGWVYVPADFDTKEKALSGAKAAEKGLK